MRCTALFSTFVLSGSILQSLEARTIPADGVAGTLTAMIGKSLALGMIPEPATYSLLLAFLTVTLVIFRRTMRPGPFVPA